MATHPPAAATRLKCSFSRNNAAAFHDFGGAAANGRAH
jgi:hypothetical protein